MGFLRKFRRYTCLVDFFQQMNLEELKEFVKEASDLAAAPEKPKPEVTEEDVAEVNIFSLFSLLIPSCLSRCPWRS